MKAFLTSFLMGLAALSVTSCAPEGAAPPEEQVRVFHGLVESGFELNVFHPDTGEGPWWFSAETSVWDTLQERKMDGQIGKMFFVAEIKFEGELDRQGGRFGHMGEYPAEVYANRLLSHEALTIEAAEAMLEAYRQGDGKAEAAREN